MTKGASANKKESGVPPLNSSSVLEVQMSASNGESYNGAVQNVELSFGSSIVQINSATPGYYTSFKHCSIRLLTEQGERVLKLNEGFASLKQNRLTIVAAESLEVRSGHQKKNGIKSIS